MGRGCLVSVGGCKLKLSVFAHAIWLFIQALMHVHTVHIRHRPKGEKKSLPWLWASPQGKLCCTYGSKTLVLVCVNSTHSPKASSAPCNPALWSNQSRNLKTPVHKQEQRKNQLRDPALSTLTQFRPQPRECTQSHSEWVSQLPLIKIILQTHVHRPPWSRQFLTGVFLLDDPKSTWR